MAEKKKVAAFFDFDGIWFLPNENWQVKNPHLGIVGSAIPWEKACFDLAKLRRKEKRDLQVERYYYLPPPKWNTVELEGSSNVTPPEYLPELIRRHENSRHDLYLISQSDCPELLDLTDFPIPENRKRIKREDLFKNISFSLQSHKDVSRISTELYIQEKTYRILNFLRRAGRGQSQAQSKKDLTRQRPETIYDQIFLYHTQIEYKKLLLKVLQKYQANLASKGMSLIDSYIAKVK